MIQDNENWFGKAFVQKGENYMFYKLHALNTEIYELDECVIILNDETIILQRRKIGAQQCRIPKW